MRELQLVGNAEEDIYYKSFLLTLKLQPDVSLTGVSADFCCREWPCSHLSSPLLAARLVPDLTTTRFAECVPSVKTPFHGGCFSVRPAH